MSNGNALALARASRATSVDMLREFIRFPTVSAQPKHAADIRRCVRWLAEQLERIGLENVAIERTARHPLVYCDWRHAPGRPTVLVYGHFDVQPAEPIAAWKTPPFEPSLRGKDLFGRGASDDKGQICCHLGAIEAQLRAEGRLPVNVRCIFEGEEEIGSPNLRPFLERHRNRLSSDVAVISDTRMLGPGRTAITYSLRGSTSMEIEFTALPRDVHSGSFGGALRNPVQALCEFIADLHDRSGRVRVPGFYDRVRLVSAGERQFMRQHGPGDREILKAAGATCSYGEPGYTMYERTTIRPALTFNGIAGGYQGQGGKGIIPASASIKLNFRLVPEQEPREVEQLLREHLRNAVPRGIGVNATATGSASPAVMSREHPAMRAAARAYHRGFGASPAFVRSGGTIPVVNLFREVLGISTVLLGFALPDDGMHGPNEKFHLPNLYQGIETCIHFLREVGSASRQEWTERIA
jgi:acetylornithine deacetylase/succinyl-diaminopimelate desuccinylase-like protein